MYLVIEVNTGNKSIADMNDACENAGNGFESVRGVINVLEGLCAGALNGTVKIVTKDNSTTISTHGTGSTSNTFTF